MHDQSTISAPKSGEASQSPALPGPAGREIFPTVGREQFSAVTAVPIVSSRLQGVDLAKGIAICGVLMHHVTSRHFTFATLATLGLVQCCFAWAIHVFMLASGFLCGASNHPEGFLKFCARRAGRLLVPYFTIGSVYLVWIYGVEVFRNPATGFDRGELLRRLAHYAVFREPGAEQMYFLPMLFLVSVVHEAGLRLLSKTRQRQPAAVIVVVAFVAALAAILSAGDFSRSWSLYRLSVAFLYYAFGCWLAFMPRRQWFLLGLPLSFAGLAIAWARSDAAHPAIAIAVPWIVFWFCTEAPQSLPGRALFEYLGAISAFIFIYHSPLIIHPLVFALHSAGLGDWWAISLGLTLTLAACAGLHFLVNRWRPLFFLRI